MKNLILIILLFTSTLALGQAKDAPKLELKGSNFSYTKGNIDVELLTQIIQQKQEEVAQRAFQNLVLKAFDKAGAQKSFATYRYIYNLLYTITSQKNKTVITRELLNNVLEYCFITGFTQQFFQSNEMKDERYTFKKNESFVELQNVFKSMATVNPEKKAGDYLLKSTNSSNEGSKNEVNEWKVYNMYIDMALDVILKDNDRFLQKKGLFKMLEETPSLIKWYNADNSYLINVESGKDEELKKHRLLMENEFEKFKKTSNISKELIEVFKELENTNFKQESITKLQYETLKTLLRSAIGYLRNYEDNNVIATISEYLLDYTLVEYKEETVKIDSVLTKKIGILYVDAEGLISSLHSKFVSPDKQSSISRKLWYITPKPFLSIGAAYSGSMKTGNNLLGDKTTLNAPVDLNALYFAAEKIGFKFTFVDKRYTHSFQPGEEYKFHGKKYAWIRPQKEPLIIRQELMFYGSGLLYNIVDIKSSKNFKYALAGVAYGLTFFNGLNFNVGVSLPINADNGVANKDKLLYNASFDIPIIEYITALRKKRG